MVTPQTGGIDCAICIRCGLQYEAFSSQNPWMTAVKSAAEEAGREPQAGFEGQSLPGVSGAGLQADRSCPGQLARSAGGAERGDLPQRLWLAGAAGGGRHRSEGRAVARARDAGRSIAPCSSKRIAELKSRIGEGGLREAAHSCPALRRVGERNGGRAKHRGAASGSPGLRRRATDARRVQDAGARAVLHAAAGSGRRRWPPFRSCCPMTSNQRRAALRGDARGAVGQRGDHGRARQAACSGSRRCSVSMSAIRRERASNVAPFDPKAKRVVTWVRKERSHVSRRRPRHSLRRKYDRLIAAAEGSAAGPDRSSCIPATRRRCVAPSTVHRPASSRPILVGPEQARSGRLRAARHRSRYLPASRSSMPRTATRPRRQGRRADPCRQGRTADEGQPAHRRADARRDRARCAACAPAGASAMFS